VDASPEPGGPRPTVDPASFFDLDIRVGTVVAVDEFPEARHPAWKLTVDFGAALGHRRTSARITNYTAEELLGRRVVGVCNIGSRRVAGFESEFLVLGAVRHDGEVRLLAPDEDVEPGTPVA